MNDKLYEIIMKLPKQNIINLMLNSLDLMQGYNGRKISECILESIGAKYCGEKEVWEIPPLEEIKRHTKTSLIN